MELPREVTDAEQYLGAHHYCRFYKDGPLSTEVAYMYEYKYATFGDPCDKSELRFRLNMAFIPNSHQ